jgi:hypothetical protein
MNNILHATFDTAEDGIQAVESLLHHSVRAEDINLILPQSQTAGAEPTANPHASPSDSETRIALDTDAPYPPPLPPQTRKHNPRIYREEDFMAPGALGYTYDTLGAVIPDPIPSDKPAPPVDSSSEALLDTKEGVGLGLGLGLLAAMCVPGIGLIVGSGAIVAGLMAAGTVFGGIAGDLYGYLIDRGVAHGIARVLSHHHEAGGTILSVSRSGTLNKAEFVRIFKEFDGHLLPPS